MQTPRRSGLRLRPVGHGRRADHLGRCLRPRISPRQFLCLLVLFGVAAASSPTLARRVTLRADGTGDVTSFQAGVDLLASEADVFKQDTLEVGPGYYDECVLVGLERLYVERASLAIVCPGGFERTRVRGLKFVPEDLLGGCSFVPLSVTGLGIAEQVSQSGQYWCIDWHACRFEGGYVFSSDGYAPPLFPECEFNGTVAFYNCSLWPHGLQDCRFVRATLVIFSGVDYGYFAVDRCTFEGPAETAVIIPYIPSSDAVVFRDCRFAHFSRGIALQRTEEVTGVGISLERCTFEDISGTAVAFDYAGPNPFYVWRETLGLYAADTRFERCGSAVQMPGVRPLFIRMLRDSLLSLAHSGVEASVEQAAFDNVIVKGCGGSGIVLRRLIRAVGDQGSMRSKRLFNLTASQITDNTGDGFVVLDTLRAVSFTDEGLDVRSNIIARNGGAGLRLSADLASCTDNQIFQNGGVGAELAAIKEGAPVLLRNSCVLNGGSGFELSVATASATGLARVENNIFAFNQADGLVVGSAYSGSFHFNDAWRNGGAAYAGFTPAGDNLLRDPRLCDPLNGDLHVQAGSPCAPDGPYGQIGALGVGCVSSPVSMAVSPGQPNRPLNLGSHAPVPFAVLASAVLDATDVDPASVTLGGAAASPGRTPAGHPTMEDVNQDGLLDLLFHVDASDILPSPGGALALEARTFDGARLSGAEAVRVLLDGTTARRKDSTAGRIGDTGMPAAEFALRAILPNPARSSVAIWFTLDAPGQAVVRLFDVAGRQISSRSARVSSSGIQRMELPLDSRLPPGIYLVRLESGARSAFDKFAVIR